MKHLLILLSFLLLSSPVIGQETGVLYQYETSSGLVWKTFGDGKVQPKYTGEIKNGKMDGLGVLTYPYGEKSVVGEWKNGKEWDTKNKNKEGKLLGKFENGEWIGNRGVLYIGKRNGESGWYEEKWEGVVSEDNMDYWKYEGEIKNGLPNGQGTSTFPDGQKYVGKHKDGLPNGQGTKTFPDGRKYLGMFKNGLLNGQGKMTFPRGSSYVGVFKDGIINYGTTTSSGDRYVGGLKNLQKHGQGEWTSNDGNKYVGNWKDGMFHGKGTLSQSDGTKTFGEWKNGDMWNSILYNKDENIFIKYVNGRMIKP